MKIFVAGATGAIGSRLVPLLISSGHQVVTTTRTQGRADALQGQGAQAVIMDGLNRESVIQAVSASRPDVIVHQMTALASMRSLKNFDSEFALTNRLRTEGTENLLAAARAAGTRKVVVQSYAGWPTGHPGSRITTEEDPFVAEIPKTMSQSLAAIRKLEDLATSSLGVAGTVLRYGSFYGPGTSTSADGEIVRLVRQRKFPVVGDGEGIWSFLHVDDAASATRLAIENEVTGIFNIVDDEPAEVSVWLVELARIIGAKPPRHVPAWIGKLALGESGVFMMTQIPAASNAKAKRILGWRPKYASWREGFAELSESAQTFGAG